MINSFHFHDIDRRTKFVCIRESEQRDTSTKESIRWIVAISLLISTGLTGCCTTGKKVPETKSVSEVINAVKSDLAQLGSQPISFEQLPKPESICKDESGLDKVHVELTAIKLNLKTVSGKENASSAGLEAPLGVLSIDPTYSGSYLRSNTNALEISLSPPTATVSDEAKREPEGPLYQTIAAMAKELLAVDRTKSPCLKATGAKSTINFDVVNKSSGGIGIKVLGFKLGDKITAIDEFHQTIEVTFDLKGTTPLLTRPIK